MGEEEMASSRSQLGAESQNDSTTHFGATPRTGALSQAAFRQDRPKKFQIMPECTDADAQPLLSNSGQPRGRLSMPRPFKPDLEQGTTSPEQLMRGGRRWPSQAKESISFAYAKWERNKRERLVKAAERSLKKQLLDIDRCLAALKLKHQKHSK